MVILLFWLWIPQTMWDYGHKGALWQRVLFWAFWVLVHEVTACTQESLKVYNSGEA